MINKLKLISVINKYNLGLNESVKWNIKDKTLEISFMTPTKDVIGKVIYKDFDIEDSQLAIYDTRKLINLISICNGDLILNIEKNKVLCTKLRISDPDFDVTFALADPLLINKVGTVNTPEWDIELDFTSRDMENLIKAKNALTGIDDMIVSTVFNPDQEIICQFTFGSNIGHNSNITYNLLGKISKPNIKIPFNSELFRLILYANKDIEKGKIYLSEQGLMYLKFENEQIFSEYYMVRKADDEF